MERFGLLHANGRFNLASTAGAAALLISVDDNSQRLHSEAATGALSGLNPIPASSARPPGIGQPRQEPANAALHRTE